MLRQLKTLVKAAMTSFNRQRGANRLKKAERHVTRAELVSDLRKLGVLPGDTLFVHSSLKSLGYVEGGATEVVRALQEAVGAEGSLLLPTYYMPGGTILGTCELKDYVFDARKHGTNMGRLPEAFLSGQGVHRSIHPTHSVSAWGRHAAYLTESHHRSPSVFGRGSPWQRFLEIENAKVLGLGISMGPVTFYHLLEDTLGDAFPIPVWQNKTYQLPCLDGNGNFCIVPVRPFNATLSELRIDHKLRTDLRDYFQKEFERAGLRMNGSVGSADSWIIPAQGFFDHLKKLADEKITIYSTEQELAARPLS
ncbi:MAG: AAC(3) family N-acetyltransferase [Pseudomonadota bacterium]